MNRQPRISSKTDVLWVVCVAVLTGVCGAGCATNGARPDDALAAGPRVGWDAIVPVRDVAVRDGYWLLRTAPTHGLFPASLGVTRLAFAEDGTGEGRTLRLERDPRNEFLQWNCAFDDQMAISEAFPIDQRDLAGGDAETPLVLAAFRALEARLGLIYAVNRLGAHETEMIGALYDVPAGEPLAVIHASAVSLPLSEPGTAADDPWKTDSRALVRTAFAGHVYECLRTLIARDQPADVESPDGWTPAGPIMPVEWPPPF